MRLVIVESPDSTVEITPGSDPIPGKRCTKCKAFQPLSRFVRDKSRKDGRHPHCSTCVAAYKRGWSARSEVIEKRRSYQLDWSRRPERVQQIQDYQRHVLPSGLTRSRRFKIKYQYGLSEDAYMSMLHKQHGRCAICDLEFAKHQDVQIDHCHATGIVRGLLCVFCNRGLGFALDSPDILRSAIRYLEAVK
jgi:hypothetical protein